MRRNIERQIVSVRERREKVRKRRYINIYINVDDRDREVGGGWGCRDKILRR